MSDYRYTLTKDIEASLATVLDRDTHALVVNRILTILSEYEVTKRCTEIVTYDDVNERTLKRYCACLNIDGKSQKTIYAYSRTLIRFLDFIRKPVTEIGTYDVRFFLASEKERGISDTTLESTRVKISAFFGWMFDEEMIEKNPCRTIKSIKTPKTEKHAFSSIELDALRNACRNNKERAMIEVLVSSGVRVSELTNLDVSDIDFSTMAVQVRQGKGGKDRRTYINDIAMLYLKKYLLTRSDNSNALFLNHSDERMGNGGVRVVLNTIGKRAKVDNVHPHRFRRTFATGLAARGMAVQEIQKLLGHTNINTTMRYVQMDDRKVKASYQQYIA